MLMERFVEEKEKLTPEETNTKNKIKTEHEKPESPSTPMTKIIEVDEIVQLELFDNL